MIDTTQYTKTHELYTQFGQWLGVDGTIDSNYFMINYSLHAAENYIRNYYNINLTMDTIFEKVNKSSTFSPTFPPTKILNMFKSGEVTYPAVSYLDSTSFSIITSQGGYSRDMDLYSSTEDFHATYLTGYIYTDSTDYSDIDFDDEFRLPEPRLVTQYNEPVTSPFEVYEDTITFTVIGEPLSNVLVNDSHVGTLSSQGVLEYTTTVTQEVTTLVFKLVSATDETLVSRDVKVLIVNVPTTPKPYLHILGYDLKVNTKNARVIVAAPLGSSLSINGEVLMDTDLGVPVITKELVTYLDLPIVTELESKIQDFKVESKRNGRTSEHRNTRVQYDSSLTDSYLNELNKYTTFIPYLPEDLMVAMFKLANHFYNGTLYNNSGVESLRTANGVSQTYTSHSIPEDIKNLLSTYVHYRA